MREGIFPAMIDECRTWMGEPSLVFDVSNMKNADVSKLKEEIRSMAEKNGYPNRVLKRDNKSLYVF